MAYRMPIIKAPDSSLGPKSAHLLSPTFTPLEGADPEGSNKEKHTTERARLGGWKSRFQAPLCWHLAG